MSSGRHYTVLSGIADFYFFALALGIPAGLYVATVHSPIPAPASLVVILLALICTVVYHAHVAKSVRWLSPGEQMHGRTIVNDSKQWSNPWFSNRWALFGVNLLALVLLANTWDALTEVALTFPQVTTRTLIVVLVSAGLILLGKGNSVGAMGPLLLYVSQGVGVRQIMRDSNDLEGLLVATVAFGGIAAIHLLVVGTYAFRRHRARLSVAAAVHLSATP